MKHRIVFAALAVLCAAAAVLSQNKPRIQTPRTNSAGTEMSIIVTAVPHGDKEREVAAKLQPSDFAVYENKVKQRIVSVKSAADAPISVAVVVQDDLNWRVNSEIRPLKDFIGKLPEGTRVMTAYLTTGGAITTQELTDDRKQAADSLRIIRGGSLPPSFSPFDGVAAIARKLETAPGRRVMIVVSNGFDASRGFAGASPYLSSSLDRAIREAQRAGVAVYTIYAPGAERRRISRFEYNYGQGCLIRLADETGGESYFTGFELISFAPYLEEFNETSGRQWLIVYRSSTVGKGFRRIEVTTDFDIHLHYSEGYQPRPAK
jgi:VWFA-related protein